MNGGGRTLQRVLLYMPCAERRASETAYVGRMTRRCTLVSGAWVMTNATFPLSPFPFPCVSSLTDPTPSPPSSLASAHSLIHRHAATTSYPLHAIRRRTPDPLPYQLDGVPLHPRAGRRRRVSALAIVCPPCRPAPCPSRVDCSPSSYRAVCASKLVCDGRRRHGSDSR